MRLLLLADREISFQGRYLAAISDALAGRGAETATFVAPARRLYHAAVREAQATGCDHVHACFMQDAPALLDAIASSAPQLTWSFSTFGLGAMVRSSGYLESFSRLAERDEVTRILVHSIHPQVAARRARDLGIATRAKVVYVREPIYDPPDAFLVSRAASRDALGLPVDRTIALCFGAFSPKKGGDLLVAAATGSATPLVLLVGAGASELATPGPNLRVDASYVDYAVAAQYFRACDFVVLPYRRDYEDDTSGVLVQAALAERPVIVPDVSPFRETVGEFELGATFECENVDSLAAAIAAMTRTTAPYGGFGHYLAGFEPWSQFAALVGDRT